MNDAFYAPLPPTTRVLATRNTHAGLWLDKFAPTWSDAGASGKLSEQVQKPTLALVVNQSKKPEVTARDFATLRERQRRVIQSSGALCSFIYKSVGPLTLHLARASALENAGICLHPVYGFVYLPGSGVKGMARAYAETVWLPQQPDEQNAKCVIGDVFGWAAASRGQRENLDRQREHVGQVVFHDAWPVEWPRLEVDILNNHHHDYYSHDDNEHAPGDWENPMPVYFLAVPAGARFEFALTKRRADVNDTLLSHAQEWLQGALCHLGAGAKTASGYGAFRPDDASSTEPRLTGSSHLEYETTLELVTPAFLAGASQQSEDCDLRPATLRGLLRWWWRTMHAGFVDVVTLRQMETAVWGDARNGGAVRVEVRRRTAVGPFERPGKILGDNKRGQKVLNNDPAFFDGNDLVPAPWQTTQGLFYASYGTDEMRTGDVGSRKHRWCLGEGSSWQVRFVARGWKRVPEKGASRRTQTGFVEPAWMMEQAKTALWLLCHYGSVGAKARKGFGSWKDIQIGGVTTIAEAIASGTLFRDRWRELKMPFGPGKTGTAALNDVRIVEHHTPWRNPWFVLDQIGALAQDFAQAPPVSGHGKHCSAKVALGLPRKIHGPSPTRLPHQQGKWNPPTDLASPKGERYGAPIHYHVADDSREGLSVRALVFFPEGMWNSTDDSEHGRRISRTMLEQLATHVAEGLSHRSREYVGRGQKKSTSGAISATGSRSPDRSPSQQLPKVGDIVRSELLSERTKKGGWRAMHLESRLTGPIQNSGEVPSDKQAGDKLSLLVKSVNPREIAFQYLSDDELARRSTATPSRSQPGSGRGGPTHRGRRS